MSADHDIDGGAWGATENSDISAKRMIREAALASIPHPRVLDLYAGSGEMYHAAWHRADAYLGIEARPIPHPARRWIGDNAALLPAAMVEDAWSILDLDAFGNPWPLLAQAIPLLRAERWAATLTCGIRHGLRVGKARPETVRALGMEGLPLPQEWTSVPPLAYRWYDDLVRWLLRDAGAGATWDVETCRRIHKRGEEKTWHWLVVGVKRPE